MSITSFIWGFTQDKTKLYTRKKKQVSFSSKKLHNYFRYHCHLTLEKMVKTAIEEGIELKGDDFTT